MDREELSRLRQKFESFWQEIRSAELTAGQPRSRQSSASVTLAREALRLATASGDEELLIQAWRMLAYALNANEDYREAIPYYERVIPAFEARGEYTMASRQRIGYVSVLTHTGQYEKALTVSLEAEQWMLKEGDEIGYARLCTNVANIYQRLDLHVRAFDYYQNAVDVFRKVGDLKAQGQVYLNLGYILAQMNRFEEADESYERSETISSELKLPDLWAQASYNRAYLHYLRGRYADALQAFARLRKHFQGSGSLRHYALCDLDEAEIYLQLNLSTDAATLAKQASEQFAGMGMAYEAAKAQTYYGMALNHMRRFGEALEVFKAAQKIFEEEGNEYFVGVLDLHRSDVHLSLQRYWEAHALAIQAKARFESLEIPSRRIASLILLGRIALALDELEPARKHVDEIFAIIEQTNVPLMLFPCYVLSAQISERNGDIKEAARLYELAAQDLEVHQSRLQHDDLRVTFLQGKNQVYESLVWISLEDGELAPAYSWCERAKSRGLIELLSHHLPSIQVQGERSLIGRINRLREELNFHYTKAQPEKRSTVSRADYQEVAIKEQELARSLREIASTAPQYVSLQQVSVAELETVQQFLPERTTIIEYFSARDEIMAFVIKRDGARVVRRLAPSSRVLMLQEKLAFQLEKFLLGPDYTRAHSQHILEATNHHLRSLYQVLIEPLLPEMQTPHITIIPHGSLHFIPFHALFDGSRYLTDQFEMSYCPSASVLKYCMEKEDIAGAEAVILGVPDENAPMVEDEVRRLHAVYPEARILAGQEATRQAFGKVAERTEFLHIATHATFRQDNPMFSSFKLADGYVTALDLFSLTCQTNLVTLSGCKSGLGNVSGSDDLLGLMRAFLYAGARSLLLSLWNVSDESTVTLMTSFYAEWRSGASKPQALQRAMKIVREQYPNPFYWAPFVLIGKV